jgi:hypothetical protein
MYRIEVPAAVVIVFCASCTTSTPEPQIQAIVVTPSEVTVQPGATVRFSASVVGTGAVSQDVLWSLEPDPGHDQVPGSIDNNGTFSAWQTRPAQTVRASVIAVSAHHRPGLSYVTGSARVQVPSASLTIAPETATVFLGDSLQFEATINGTTDRALSWSSANGTVDSNGLYQAPDVMFSGDSAEVVVYSFALGLQARARVTLKFRPMLLTGISGPAGPGDHLTIFGTNFQQIGGTALVLFPSGGRDPISVPGYRYVPYTDRFDVVVPIGATSGLLRVGQDEGPGAPVFSEPIAFERAPRLRLRPDRIDIAAGESMRLRVAVLGSDRSFPLVFNADRGTFNGDVYVAPDVPSLTFVDIRVCVAGTSICSGATIAVHPFRIEPPFAVVPSGGSMRFSAVRGDTAAEVSFSLTGPGSLTSDGRFTAPVAMIDSGPSTVHATDGTHGEDAQVSTRGLVPGLVGRVAEYIDHRVPDGTPGRPFGSIAEAIAVGGAKAYVLARSFAGAESLFQPSTLYWIDVYDLSDPLHPAWVGAVESATRPMSMAVSHGRLYAFSTYDSSATYGRTIAVYDLSHSLPQLLRRVVAPLQVGTIPFFTEPPVLDDDFLYVFGTASNREQPLEVYRLSDGPLENPRSVVVPFPPLTSSISSFSAQDGRAYAPFFEDAPQTDFPRLAAWDITTSPARLLGVTDATIGIALAGPPTYLGPFVVVGSCLYDRTESIPVRAGCLGSGAIVAADRNRFIGAAGAMFDLTGGPSVRPAGRIPSVGGGGAGFSGGYLFIAEGTGGIGIYDASLDGGPIFGGDLGFTQPYVFPKASVGIAGPDRLLYGAGLAFDELHLLGWAFVAAWDSQSSPPAFVWQERVSSEGSPDCAPQCAPTAIAVVDDLLLVGRVNALEVRSLATPRSPELIAELPVGVSAITALGSIPWIGTRDGRLLSLDLSIPTSPAIRGQLSLSGLADGIAVLGTDTLVLAEVTADRMSGDLAIIDASSLAAPVQIGSAGLGLACSAVAVDGAIAAIATSAGLATVSLADVFHPTLRAIEPLVASGFGATEYRPLAGKAVTFNGGLTWVTTAGYVSGEGDLAFGLGVVFAYDLRDPDHPREVTRIDTGIGSGLVFDGDRAIALGDAPGELKLPQPRNVTLSLRSPRQLQR